MNTPSPLILNLAMQRRPTAPNLTWSILIGAVVPDAALFMFYVWVKGVQRLPELVIGSEAYYSQPWQDRFALGHSIPLAAIGVGLALSPPGIRITTVGWALRSNLP